MICRIVRDRFRDAQGSEPRTERAPVDTQTIKDRRTGSGRPRSPSGAAAQFPSVRRPSPRAMVVLAHDHSHIPFPSCNYTLVHIHTHERTAQAIVSGEGQFAVRTRAHAATPSASQHVSKHPTGRHGNGGIQHGQPAASPASEAMCDNAAPLPSRCARSSTGWPTFVRRKPWPLAQQAVIQLASSGKRARFRTYTLRRGRR